MMMVGVQKRVERDGRVRGAGFLKYLMKAKLTVCSELDMQKEESELTPTLCPKQLVPSCRPLEGTEIWGLEQSGVVFAYIK